MDTAKLKKMAQYIRKELISIVTTKLETVLLPDSIERRESKNAISALEGLIDEITKEQVVEKVAYTWFNRFCALRYMEVNKYTKINVVSPITGQFQPEILAEAKMGYIDNSIVPSKVIEKIKGLLNNSITSKDPQGEAYKLLIIAYCNYYNQQMPFLFEKINDYTELLMPDDLISGNSVIAYIREALTPENCSDIEVIGWLYQYYISEKKDEVFAELKKGKKISKENVPAATQIFTPKWIVSYMVENSVGKLWLESHPDERLQSQFKYYLESAGQEPEVQAKLDELINKDLKPQDIKVLDPACGSGHILVKAFDVLFEIYKSQGWQENEIPEMILKNNLYGLDICDRAAQLAQFAVMMKARAFDRNIFNKVKELNICSIKDTNWMDSFVTSEIISKCDDKEKAKEQVELLQSTFREAKEYGSILEVKDIDFDFWNKYLLALKEDGQIRTCTPIIKGRLPYILKQARIMQQKYESVISNPPYMGNKGMSAKLSEYVKKNFKNTKTDFFSVFMEKNYYYTINNGYTSMITQPSWLFLSSFEELRKQILDNQCIMSVLHMGRGIFGIDFGSCAFTFRKLNIKNYMGSYFRLHQRTFQFINPNDIENLYLTSKDNHDFEFNFSTYKANNNGEELEDENTVSKPLKIYFEAKQNGFHSIPGSPIAYWASDRVRELFKYSTNIKSIAPPRAGMQTGENEIFIRAWQEISINKMYEDCNNCEESENLEYKWYPYNNGGPFRKWYGNKFDVVNWYKNGRDIKQDKLDKLKKGLCLPSNSKPKNMDFYFKESITWSFVSSTSFGVRYSKKGSIFDIAGSSVFASSENIKYLTGYLCSKLVFEFLKLLNPTLNFQVGNVASLPVIIPENKNAIIKVEQLVNENISISKDDWDSFETSWDFQDHPLLRFRSKISQGLADDLNKSGIIHIKPLANGDFRQYNWAPNDKIEECFLRWKEYKQEQFNKLKANEEELNKLFIEIYELQDEMDEKVEDKDITLKGSLETEKDCIKSLLSYAVGCMFGRYSLDEKGLTFAGGEFDLSKYKSFPADEDAVIPVLSEHLFSDDITSRFKEFLKVAFGETYFEENLEYVASVLGKKNTETADDTIRNYFMKDFYNDHIKMYQKRPIYWMFSSPKGNFNALVYMHRYNKDTASVILNSYLRNFRDEKLKAQIENCKQIELSASTSQGDKIKASKRREELEKIVKEVTDYERDILYPLATERKEIDLDDGVKVNYLKFGKALKDFGLKAKK